MGFFYICKIRLFPVFPNRLLCGLLLRIRLLRLLGRFLIGCLYSLGVLFQFFLAVKIDVRAFQRLRLILRPTLELLWGAQASSLHTAKLPVVFHIIPHMLLPAGQFVPVCALDANCFQRIHILVIVL